MTDYDLPLIVNEMEKYYKDNNLESKVLLKRLRELKVNASFMEMFNGGFIGILIGGFIFNPDFTSTSSDLLRHVFSQNLFFGFLAFLTVLLIIALFAGVGVGLFFLFKFSYLRMVKSANLSDFLDEKEIELINKILDERISQG